MVSFRRFRVLDHALRYIASQRRRSEIMMGCVKRNQNNVRFVAAVKMIQLFSLEALLRMSVVSPTVSSQTCGVDDSQTPNS